MICGKVGRRKQGASGSFDYLLQQAQHAAAVLVGLRQHALRRLQQDVRPCVVGEGLRHVGVADRAFGGRDVFVGNGQVRRRVFEAALYRADGGLLAQRLCDGSIDNRESRGRLLLRGDLAGNLAFFVRPNASERISARPTLMAWFAFVPIWKTMRFSGSPKAA